MCMIMTEALVQKCKKDRSIQALCRMTERSVTVLVWMQCRDNKNWPRKPKVNCVITQSLLLHILVIWTHWVYVVDLFTPSSLMEVSWNILDNLGTVNIFCWIRVMYHRFKKSCSIFESKRIFGDLWGRFLRAKDLGQREARFLEWYALGGTHICANETKRNEMKQFLVIFSFRAVILQLTLLRFTLIINFLLS